MDLCSVVVHARAERVEAVRAAMTSMEGVEVHGFEQDGRMVVTVENEDAGRFGDAVLQLQHIEGVLNANIVYHFHEDQFQNDLIETGEEEMSHEADPA